jgi:hypothetical protein
MADARLVAVMHKPRISRDNSVLFDDGIFTTWLSAVLFLIKFSVKET